MPRRAAAGHPIPALERSRRRDGTDPSREADRILLSKNSPAGVLVDESLEVLEIRGRPAPFLTLPAGKVSFHLLKLIPDTGLFLEVEKLVQEASQTGEPAHRERVADQGDERIGEVRIEVDAARPWGTTHPSDPLRGRDTVEAEDGNARGLLPNREGASTGRDREIVRLKQELEGARHGLGPSSRNTRHPTRRTSKSLKTRCRRTKSCRASARNYKQRKKNGSPANEELIGVNRDLEG